MPCQCCGQRLPGEPTRAEIQKARTHEARLRRYHTGYREAMGLRAEGVPEKEIARVRGLYNGMGIEGRRRLRDTRDYAPGMVQRWGRHIVITDDP